MTSHALNLLPLWVTCLWLVALAAVLITHCGHFVRMGGQQRWFHASHILMLVGMLYMFASMGFSRDWIPASQPTWPPGPRVGPSDCSTTPGRQ